MCSGNSRTNSIITHPFSFVKMKNGNLKKRMGI